MTKKREQTTLRTVRIPQELDNALETISKERGLSVNSFVSMLLKKYVEWDKYAERFGYVTLTRESLRSILQATDDSKLIESAQDYGSTVPNLFELAKMAFVAVARKDTSVIQIKNKQELYRALTNREKLEKALEQGLNYILSRDLNNTSRFERLQRGNRDKIVDYFMNIKDKIEFEGLRFY